MKKHRFLALSLCAAVFLSVPAFAAENTLTPRQGNRIRRYDVTSPYNNETGAPRALPDRAGQPGNKALPGGVEGAGRRMDDLGETDRLRNGRYRDLNGTNFREDTYTVKRYDTLWKISRKYGVDLDEVIRANPQFADPDLIYPNDRVYVPLEYR